MLVEIDNIPAYTINRIGNAIYIKEEQLHPFGYPYELYEIISKITEDIPDNYVDVYMDFTRHYSYPKIIKMKFNKLNSNFDFSTEEDVCIFNLPEEIRELL